MTPSSILIDLRCAQFHGDRGIPAYSQSLALELCRGFPAERWLLLHDESRPPPSRAGELAVHAPWCTSRELASRSQPIDVLVTGWFFPPHPGRGADYLLPSWLRLQRPRRLGIVYDLVPWIFPDRYLRHEPARRQYREGLGVLRDSDHLFGISQATCRDITRLVGVDPRRVHCIFGDIDHRKRELMRLPAHESAGIPLRHGLGGPYCACIGGDDWRKNLEAMVRAFAIFHRDHPDHQLAIVCRLAPQRVAELGRLAAALGLPPAAVVCTGFVSDADLVGLMRHAAMHVCPSLSEGLGLPVLESYGCGVPVVGSATSSVGELVIPELAFDPRDPVAIAARMHGLATAPALAEKSLAFGRGLLAGLGWARAAATVMRHLAGTRPPARGSGRKRLAIVAALPPARTAIAQYTLRHLQSERWRSDFFDATSAPRFAAAPVLPSNRVLPVEVLRTVVDRGRHDAVIHVLGNSEHHVKVLEALMRSRRAGGAARLAYLHEANLSTAFLHWLGDDYRLLPAAESTPSAAWIRRVLARVPDIGRCLRFLVERGELDGVIVNSLACRDLVRDALGTLAGRWSIDVAFNPVEPAPAPQAGRVDDGVLRIGSFGIGGDGKRLDCLARAAAVLARTRPVRLVIAGWDVGRYARRIGIATLPFVDVHDSPADGQLLDLMRGIDVAVQLRSLTHGESSGAVAQLVSLGRQLVTSAEGSFAELPPGLTTFVAADCDPEELARAIAAAARRRIAAADLAEILAGLSPQAFADRIDAILEARRPAITTAAV
jgi:glycosyltransferase involved in cell wall biosynthesis